MLLAPYFPVELFKQKVNNYKNISDSIYRLLMNSVSSAMIWQRYKRMGISKMKFKQSLSGFFTHTWQQRICILIAVLLMIGGICYVSITSDSILFHATLSNNGQAVITESYFEPLEISHAQELTTENLSLSLSQSVSYFSRALISPLAILLGWAIIFCTLFIIDSDSFSFSNIFLDFHQRTTLFIHNKDGKKRK